MKLVNFLMEIPTWDNGVWTTTTFNEIEDFRDFVQSLFKEPGKYEFDETSFLFNEQARTFKKLGKIYTPTLYLSKDYITYWDTEKAKCINGVIFKHADKTWYLPRGYYMWLNFLPIYDKINKVFDFPQVWDGQYHMASYELLAELNWAHAAIFKKRQFGSSYFHMAMLINHLWFDQGVTLKMGASLKDYINLSGSWKFLEEYKSFLNENTAWYRPMNPSKVLEWQQKIEVTRNGRTSSVGLKGTLQGMSFEQSPTKGVGGPTLKFFHEEAGIAPQMDKTYEFIRPAMQSGEITTGTFIAAGSVGKLSDAEPLKEMIYNPKENGIFPVFTNLIDDKGTEGWSGLFIPEQWCMPPYIDQYGNSLVEEALEALNKQDVEWKKTLRPDIYQLRRSQHPRNLKEGFAHRELSIFPTELIEAQERAIEEGNYPYEILDLLETTQGEIVVKKSHDIPIRTFPIKRNEDDKRGAFQVWERPDKNAPWGTYIASIDPVGVGRTTTSESLCAIYVYKLGIEVKRYNEDGTIENYIEGDKVVAAWCGRFDDINDTHQRLRLIIEWYNAQAIVENNISLFNMYMMKMNKQKHLVRKNEILFLKEVQANQTVYQDYGWKNVGTIFKNHLLSYLVEFLKEVVNTDTNDEGVILKKYYGIQRIPDIMALKEMLAYKEGLNVDRLIALSALIAFVNIREANKKRIVRVENMVENNLENTKKMTKLIKSAFTNIGKGSSMSTKKRRSTFNNMR